MRYTFCITEILQKEIEIEEENKCKAQLLIDKQYREGQILLDAEDYKITQIELLK
ncbi:MAG: hypothetical protein KBS69_02300 [Bacteroidales bacterium]|nr:hypothetical protein [Candidatus Colicola caccequi]